MYQIDILKWEMAKFSLRIKFLEHFDLQTLIIFLSEELFLEFTQFSIFELDPFLSIVAENDSSLMGHQPFNF